MRFNRFYTVFPVLLSLFLCLATQLAAQTVLIDHNFQTTSLPSGVTSNGAISPTKAADGVCSMGMIQVNAGQYMQVDVTSCSEFRLHMKSTSGTARLVTIKYKKDGEPTYTTVTTNLSVQTAAIFNLTTLFPAIVSSVPVSVRVEPAGNIQIHDLYVTGSASLSAAAEITSFKLNGQVGNEVINSSAGTVAINVPLGTSLNSVVPQSVVISSQAAINPAATTARDFTAPVQYTVTAQNGTTKNWTINVTQVASSAKEITGFTLSPSQIGNSVINSAAGTISVTMPNTVSITSITPSMLNISPNAGISPSAASALNFTSPVQYTVTAQDASTKIWTVTVTVIDPSATYFDYEAEQATFTGSIDNNHAGHTGTGFINFLSGGENSIIFTVCQTQAAARTAKFRYALATTDDRKGKLFVNDVFVQTINFTQTTAWTDWAEEVATVNLQSGINNIKITWDSTDGPNLDKMLLTGQSCNAYTLNVTATNGGIVSVTPVRTNNRYFDVETITLLAQGSASVQFNNWSGDLSGSINPESFLMAGNKTIVANFNVIPTYKLTVAINGIGQVQLNPPGGDYPLNTVVTLTPQGILGSTFTGWSGDLGGNTNPATITITGNKSVIASFASSYNINFENVIGFAAAPGDGMSVPTTGGQCASDTVFINGPAEFNKLCEALYYRQQAYKTNTVVNGMKKAPLVILLRAGTYDGTQTLSTNGAKAFGNSMLDIPEQGDLSFIGEANVHFKIGINVKRSWNTLIRNISFYDYYDDGINIGYPETHHIWIDHCTFGHPTTMPADTEHPDGGCDVKDGASYVTISWCVFRNSWKTSLIGHSDGNGATDIGRLKVTMVNNYFYNTNSRNPRVRFGEVHVLNNLSQNVMLYGIAAANSARVFAENNFYLNTDWPMYADRTVTDFKAVYGNNTDNTYTSKTGNYPAVGLKQSGNEYDDSGLPVITAQLNPLMKNPGGRSVKFDELNPSSVFSPASYYAYTPMTASETRIIIPMYAGADKVSFSQGCGSLPVQLLSFNATLENEPGKHVKVIWKTTNEVNTHRFEVEKSTNGYDFKKINTVAAKNTAGEHEYYSNDIEPFQGLSYYRLKQVDVDGKFTYSSIVAIKNVSTASIKAFPNPARETIAVTHPRSGTASVLKLINAEGKTVLSVNVPPGAGSSNINIHSFSAGTYMVVHEDGAMRNITRFVKL